MVSSDVAAKIRERAPANATRLTTREAYCRRRQVEMDSFHNESPLLNAVIGDDDHSHHHRGK